MGIMLSVLIVLGFMLLLWLLQNIQHEGLHALMAAIFGAIDIKLYPFPTWEEGKVLPKYWAHMLYNSNGVFKDWQYGILSCAPQLVNTLIMLIIFIVLMTVSMPHLLSLFLLALFLTNFIDGAVNLGSLIYRDESNGNDAWSAIFWLNIKLQTARVIVLCWYIIFAALWFILTFL
jgi:hypothetical protein